MVHVLIVSVNLIEGCAFLGWLNITSRCFTFNNAYFFSSPLNSSLLKKLLPIPCCHTGVFWKEVSLREKKVPVREGVSVWGDYAEWHRRPAEPDRSLLNWLSQRETLHFMPALARFGNHTFSISVTQRAGHGAGRTHPWRPGGILGM